MNSAIAVAIGLAIAIFLIYKKCLPVYALIAGALVSGLLAGWGFDSTVKEMFAGVRDITPAVVRILAAGVLTGMLVVTGSAESISKTIVRKLGRKHAYLALASSSLILTGIGVFIDVAVITIAPIALLTAKDLKLPRMKVLLAMIGGGKCGNIISPNPNTIVSAENFDAPLPSVMAAGIIPAIIGLAITVFVILPCIPEGKDDIVSETPSAGSETLPSFMSSIAGPLASVLVLSLRPLFGIVIDPAVALPFGGLVGFISTGRIRSMSGGLSYGLSKMSGIAVLLIGTGTIAGVIKASAVKDVLLAMISGSDGGMLLLAPVSSILMSAASASTTAGATIASATFSQTILAGGISAVWAAAMCNAGATVLDHLPHGSFFHATGGAAGMSFKNRIKLIPYESLIGLVLTAATIGIYLLIG